MIMTQDYEERFDESAVQLLQGRVEDCIELCETALELLQSENRLETDEAQESLSLLGEAYAQVGDTEQALGTAHLAWKSLRQSPSKYRTRTVVEAAKQRARFACAFGAPDDGETALAYAIELVREREPKKAQPRFLGELLEARSLNRLRGGAQDLAELDLALAIGYYERVEDESSQLLARLRYQLGELYSRSL